MARGYGQNSDLGLGDESGGSYGTAATRTNWIADVESSITKNNTIVHAQTRRWNGGAPISPPYVVQQAPTFNASFELSYDFMGILFEALAGVAASTSAGPPYTHTYEPTAAAKQPAKFYTIEQDVADSGNSRLVRGACLNTLSMSIQPGQLIRANTEWIAQVVNAPASAGSPTYEGFPMPRIFHYELASVSWNSLTLTSDELTGIDLSFMNNLARVFPLNNSKLGAIPHYGQEGRKATATLNLNYSTDTIGDAFATAYDAATQSDLVLTFSGTSSRAATFTLRNAFVTANAIPGMTRPDIVPYTVNLEARSDVTDPLWEITLTNASSSAIANT